MFKPSQISIYQRHRDQISPYSSFLLYSKSLLTCSLLFIAALSLPKVHLHISALTPSSIPKLLLRLKWSLLASAMLIFVHVFLSRTCLRAELLTVAPDHLKIERRFLNDSVSVSYIPRHDVQSLFIYETFAFNEINFKLGMRLESNPDEIFNPLCGDQMGTLSSLKSLRRRLLAWLKTTSRTGTDNSKSD